MLFFAAGSAGAQISIGIDIGSRPNLVVIPGYAVYYAPSLDANLFFYDGRYWIYQGDGWYSSAGYDGPWEFIDPIDVPIDLLQIPVRYYRRPPMYFHGWQSDRAPRWGEHWGQAWAQHRSGWDRPAAHDMPIAAPPALYQSQHSRTDSSSAGPPSTMRNHGDHSRPTGNIAGPNPGQLPGRHETAASSSTTPPSFARHAQERSRPAPEIHHSTAGAGIPSHQPRESAHKPDATHDSGRQSPGEVHQDDRHGPGH